MPGFSDYTAENVLQYVTGNRPTPALPSVFMGLYTAMPTSDAGTGGTEVSGGGYARAQVAGALSLAASFTTSSTTLTLAASAPAWLLALGTNGSGVSVYDATVGAYIGSVSSISGTTVTLSAAAAHASSGSADSLVFCAFPAATASSGTEPSVVPAYTSNTAQITFATPTAPWGTVLGFGLFDALSGGDTLAFDYLGNYSWLPATISSASPGVITAHAHGYNAADPVVVTAKYGGTIPTFSQSTLTGVLAVVGPTTDTFTVTNSGTAVNTSSSGDFAVRKIVQQVISTNVVAYFPASSLTLNAA